ncbi:hypothetical protein C0991_012393 [Blastosporella zonata]|nr:hypothetical protein C0991_012393 [Blastosporella zonata]
MCGRFALRLGRGEIRGVPGHDGVDADEWIDEDAFVPRYNIAPRSQAPVLRRANDNNTGYTLHTMKWGLVPHWSKHEDKSLSTTNARAENLVSSGGMWASIKHKRCAVLAQGYYEWLTRGKDKLPHFTKHVDGALMLMAGLYDSVVLEGQTTPLWSFSIVTTAANKEFEWLHERQPVILSTRAALDAWLDTSSHSWTPELSKLVQPFSDPTHPLQCYQVPKEIGKVGTESPTFIEPITNRKDGIQAMFSKQTTKPKLFPPKRSRSPITIEDTPPTKKAKTAEDSDIEVLDEPPTSSKPKPTPTSSPPKSPSKRKPTKVTPPSSSHPTPFPNPPAQTKSKDAPSNTKLESFFRKV